MSEIDFDPEDMTIDEIEEVERRTGQSLQALFEGMTAGAMPSGLQLRTMAFVVRRRSDPEFSWEQAGALKLKAIAEMTAAGPTEAAGSTSS